MSPHWHAFRQEALAAARYLCQRCKSNQDLEVHHLHYDTLGHESLNDVEVLCVSCHALADKERKKQRARQYPMGIGKGCHTYSKRPYIHTKHVHVRGHHHLREAAFTI